MVSYQLNFDCGSKTRESIQFFDFFLFLHTPMCKRSPKLLTRRYNLYLFMRFPLKLMTQPINEHLHSQVNLS